MKKLGFGSSRKLAKGGDDDSNKAALFGGASQKAANANPYAIQQNSANDPYAPKATPPPSYDGGMSDYRRDKSPVPPGGYGGAPQAPAQGSRRYGNNGSSYGDQGGYGSNRFGDSGASSAPRRAGGYGGMGMTSQEEEVGRQQLFGDAPNRYQTQSAPPTNNAQGADGGVASVSATSRAGGYGAGDDSQGYGSYENRELTAEEQEEEDIQATKQEIRFVKQQDVSSTRNALRLADQAYQTGASTLERLGAQGERIHNTERNLDLASVQNRVASEKARELKTLNRSMFAVHVANPFTSQRRQEEREAKLLDTHRAEREARDASRAAAWSSTARQDQFARDLGKAPQRQMNKQSLAERSKYQFEADSEDEDMENEIDNNIDLLHGATGKLKGLAMAMGKEVDEQNNHIDRITGKVDRVDDEIALNRARLERIK
ncbi:hypothetical protein NA57DRAFT_38209 [Rhizodiscina lignyota]|uniref:t-SNARE coiled-coil homology domain-containing protein n=1 Tax=Rhizodiscina lignyota TaxID=1504668 RepID=A0A9P4IHI9_9PEZI|nr:hypothetical protein NA57DRAFT_38209 [Rhizodiscina lignyota]